MVPGAPLEPERLKAQVYLPPHFLAHHPEVSPAVTFLVQTVIEQNGIPTAQDWHSKAQWVWSLTQTSHVVPVSLPTMLVPLPNNSRSAQYLFPGHLWNSLALNSPTIGPSPLGLVPLDEEDLAIFDVDEVTDLGNAVTRMTAAEAENEMLHGMIKSLQVLNAQMQFDM
jgi:hypothetical protein